MATDCVNLAQKHNDLICGYVRKIKDDIDRRHKYPIELNNIILVFLGNNTFRKFDIFGDELKQYIYDNGKRIKGKLSYKLQNFVCSLPFNFNENHASIDIECLQTGIKEHTFIGVISTISKIHIKSRAYNIELDDIFGHKYC